jgi:membrane protein DedA with SNARE-associated domain
MDEMLHFLAKRGYWLLVVAILGRQACLPVQANVLFVVAGAPARTGRLGTAGVISVSVSTFLIDDLAWYEAGRRMGDRILQFLCGLSQGPESCVRRATGAFARHGVRTLLFSKFVVGLDAVAAPLTGATHIPPPSSWFSTALGPCSGPLPTLRSATSSAINWIALRFGHTERNMLRSRNSLAVFDALIRSPESPEILVD